MQFALSFVALALASFVAATPTERRQTAPAPAAPPAITVTECTTGQLQCCQSTHSSTSTPTGTTGGLLGLILQGVTGQVGLTCSPIDVLSVSGTSCSAQPVCCTNNSFNGLVALGCTPVNLNL